jgi:hypothetical protein
VVEWIWRINGGKSRWGWMERRSGGHGRGTQLVEEEEEIR